MKWIDPNKQLPPQDELVLLEAEYGFVVGYYTTNSIENPEHNWWGQGYRKQEDFWVFNVVRWCKLPKRFQTPPMH